MSLTGRKIGSSRFLEGELLDATGLAGRGDFSKNLPRFCPTQIKSEHPILSMKDRSC